MEELVIRTAGHFASKPDKIKMTIELELQEDSFADDEKDVDWINKEVLVGDRTLLIHSHVIYDWIGIVTKVSDIEWINE
jgi:hypothetical protein